MGGGRVRSGADWRRRGRRSRPKGRARRGERERRRERERGREQGRAGGWSSIVRHQEGQEGEAGGTGAAPASHPHPHPPRPRPHPSPGARGAKPRRAGPACRAMAGPAGPRRPALADRWPMGRVRVYILLAVSRLRQTASSVTHAWTEPGLSRDYYTTAPRAVNRTLNRSEPRPRRADPSRQTHSASQSQ